MKALTRLCALLGLLVLSACASLPPATQAPPKPLVLISIDAFRADYYDRGLTPNLKALADTGARGTMKPSFPSLTFPNHYTLVTGKVPDHHGVVANYMYDPTHPADPNDAKAAYFDKTKSGDGFWWQGAKPMWVSAEQAGVKVASAAWPGSWATIDATLPSHVMAWSKTMTPQTQVDQLLAWMDLPADQRPGVYMLYFDAVDQDGHHHGPNSSEVDASLTMVDGMVGQVMAGLKARGIEANIIVVSDHGMIDVSPERVTYVSDLLGDPPAEGRTDPRYDLIYWGSLAMLNPAPGFEDIFKAKVTGVPHDHMQCWDKADIPARFRYGHNPRVTRVVCLGNPGWQVGGIARVGIGTDVGNHGYDPDIPEMTAIFIANGPDIKPGVLLPRFDNVDVYDLEMKLLHLPPEANDGSIAPLRSALK